MATIIETYGAFVKDQVEFQEKQAERFLARKEGSKAKAAQGRAAMFRQMLLDIETSQRPAHSGPTVDPLRLSPADIEDLPDELLNELSLNESDKKEFVILDIINDVGGIASLDRILVSLYRRTGEIEKRPKMISRLYRMTAKGLITAHPTKKGIYSTTPIEASGQLGLDGLDTGTPEEGSDLL
jgi:hypothetical protein